MFRAFAIFAVVLPLLLGGCATFEGGSSGVGGSLEHRVAQQLTLVRSGFSVGEISGRNGVLTRRAAARYLGLKPTLTEIPPAPNAVTTYTITDEDAKHVGVIGATKELQAEQDYLPYEFMLELVAERYRSTPDLIARLNGFDTNGNLRAGLTLRVPNVEPLQIARLRANGSVRAGSRENQVRIRTDLGTLEVTAPNGKLLGYFPVSCGGPATPTPRGEWKIVNMVELPKFRWDDEMLNRGIRSSDFTMFPPGPNNPVGVFWAGTSKSGVGIHGNPLPHTLVEGRSHGCIRMTNWDILEFAKLVAVGSAVTVE